MITGGWVWLILLYEHFRRRVFVIFACGSFASFQMQCVVMKLLLACGASLVGRLNCISIGSFKVLDVPSKLSFSLNLQNRGLLERTPLVRSTKKKAAVEHSKSSIYSQRTFVLHLCLRAILFQLKWSDRIQQLVKYFKQSWKQSFDKCADVRQSSVNYMYSCIQYVFATWDFAYFRLLDHDLMAGWFYLHRVNGH